MERAQHLDGLRRQRDDVQRFHLHALRRDAPHRGIEVEFGPAGADELASAHEGVGQQFHCEARGGRTRIGLDLAKQVWQLT
ncbi:hypothetical protein D9M72_558080 [compost metagenome]